PGGTRRQTIDSTGRVRRAVPTHRGNRCSPNPVGAILDRDTRRSTWDPSSRNTATDPIPRPRAKPPRSSRRPDNRCRRKDRRPQTRARRCIARRRESKPNRTGWCTPTAHQRAPVEPTRRSGNCPSAQEEEVADLEEEAESQSEQQRWAARPGPALLRKYRRGKGKRGEATLSSFVPPCFHPF